MLTSRRTLVYPLDDPQRTLYGLVGLGSVSDYVTKNSQTNVVSVCLAAVACRQACCSAAAACLRRRVRMHLR